MMDTYADGTYGHNDVATSADAAESDRVKEVTRESMHEALKILSYAGAVGSNARHIEGVTGRGHGRVSSALTNLHRMGRIAALRERRGNQTVYVLPEHVNGRETRPYRRQRPKPPAVESLNEMMTLPSRTVLLDSSGSAWQSDADGFWVSGQRYRRSGSLWMESEKLVILHQPEGEGA